MKLIFNKVDINGNGRIDEKELETCLKALGKHELTKE